MEFLTSSMGRLLIYSICVGVTIKLLIWILKRIWNIETGLWEAGALAGSVIAFLLILERNQTFRQAATEGGLILLGYFAIKLINGFFRR